MSRVQTQEIDRQKRYEIIGDFYEIIANLDSKKEVVGFFMGLLTPGEAVMFARRIQIAKLLLKGETYEDVRKKLSVGLTTVSNVAQWLYGENKEFRDQINAHTRKKKIKKEKDENFMLEKWLDKYPEHKIMKKLLGID